MTTPLERSLATTLEAGVLAAAEPDPEFFAAVHRRVRRRRRRRRALVAGCAAVLAVAVGAAGVTFAGGADQAPDVATSAQPSTSPALDLTKIPDFADLKPPGEVWPGAVRTAPSRLPDGGIYWAVDTLPDDRYLVLTGPKPADFTGFPASGFLNAKVAIFDVGRNRLTVLNDPNEAAGTDSYFTVYAGTVGDHAMWYGSATRDGKEAVDVWSAPLSGGGPRKVVTLTADQPAERADALSITHQGVIWRLPTPGHPAGESDERKTVGLYRIGPTGGTPERVYGSEGFTPGSIVDWFTSDSSLPNGHLWNVTTGERRAWTRNPAMVEELHCGPLWCGGKNTKGRAAIQKLDGSGYVELPAGVAVYPLYDGRKAYVTLTETEQGRDSVVWDMSTGRAATFHVPSPFTPVSRGSSGDFTSWEQGGKLFLLNYLKMT